MNPRSEVKIRDFLRRIENDELPPPPPEKSCAKCGAVKPLEDFTVKKVRLKSGLLSLRPESYCRQCLVKRAKKTTERLKKEGRYGEVLATKARYRDRHRDKINAKERERRAIKRDEEGKEARHKGAPSEGWEEWLPVEPLVPLLAEKGAFEEGHVKTFASRVGLDEATLRRIRDGEIKSVRLDTADRLLTNLGRPDLFSLLFPLVTLEGPEPLRPYTYLPG